MEGGRSGKYSVQVRFTTESGFYTFDEVLCRYTANNFNTVMAKNARLTIVEVRGVKKRVEVDLIGPLMPGREYRSCWLDLPKRYSSTWHLC